MRDKIKSIHIVNGKKIIVLDERKIKHKPRKKVKAKKYYLKIKNSK
jgi:hypothetical protein